MEKQAPELVVSFGHAYLDSFKSVKLAKAALKGYDEAPAASEKLVGAELVAGVSALEWGGACMQSSPSCKTTVLSSSRKKNPLKK